MGPGAAAAALAPNLKFATVPDPPRCELQIHKAQGNQIVANVAYFFEIRSAAATSGGELRNRYIR